MCGVQMASSSQLTTARDWAEHIDVPDCLGTSGIGLEVTQVPTTSPPHEQFDLGDEDSVKEKWKEEGNLTVHSQRRARRIQESRSLRAERPRERPRPQVPDVLPVRFGTQNTATTYDVR